ncbi:MAG: hypothetical protein Tsb0019_27430 [Roseibium sp.]
MAHSLFEPVPEPFGERLWRRVRGFSTSHRPLPAHDLSKQTDPALVGQAARLDARGRQQFLQAVLTARPIKAERVHSTAVAHG